MLGNIKNSGIFKSLFGSSDSKPKSAETRPTLQQAVDRYTKTSESEFDKAEALMKQLGQAARARCNG